MKRSKMGRRQSKKVFTRHARSVHPRNTQGNPMRGGIRL